jgi:hypothetical protein
VLSEVLNIPVDNTALAKRVVAAAGKGTIESFAVVCASFGEPSTTTHTSPPLHGHAHAHAHARSKFLANVILEQAHCDGTSIARGFARARTSAHPSQSHSTTISKSAFSIHHHAMQPAHACHDGVARAVWHRLQDTSHSHSLKRSSAACVRLFAAVCTGLKDRDKVVDIRNKVGLEQIFRPTQSWL